MISFAPELYIRNGVHDLSFYYKALDATEVFRFTNDDGSVHVAEFKVGDQLFHVHEDTGRDDLYGTGRSIYTTVIIGLFVPDVDAVMKKAIDAGATELSPAKDYDYGYRQGEFKDPFGHIWMIQKKI